MVDYFESILDVFRASSRQPLHPRVCGNSACPRSQDFAWERSLVSRSVLALSFCLSGCATGFTDEAASTQNSSPAIVATVEPLTLGAATTAPAGPSASAEPPSEITIAAAPYAKCTLHAPGSTDPKQSMVVYADGQGVAHIFGKKTSQAVGLLDCELGGATVSHVLDLGNPSTFEPLAVAPVAAPSTTIQPALTDPNSLSDGDLMKRGYPPRPNPQRAAAAYAKWLQVVSKPMTVVHATSTIDTGMRADSVKLWKQDLWGGLALDNKEYAQAMGIFLVPLVGGTGVTSQAVWWAGLGAPGTNDLVQDGIWMKTFSNGSFSSYTLFWEYVPVNNATPYPDVQIHPGDEILAWVGVGDSMGNYKPGLRSYYGWFWMANLTTGYATPLISKWPPNDNSWSGYGADFIMERLDGIQGQPLANYGPWFWPTAMDCYALDSTGTARDFTHDHYILFETFNALNQLLQNNAHTSGDIEASWAWLQGK
jgi:hypothetical protein